MSCEYMGRCLNTDSCFRCFDFQLLKLPKEKTSNRSMANKTASSARPNDEDSWKNLEQEVADALNEVPTIQEARRSRASGALWFEKGDVIDDIVAPECKERKGSDLVGGDKSLSFKREWLTKAREEAQENDKIMILPFRFKEDPNTYIAMYSEDIYELINIAKAHMRDNDIKTAQLNAALKVNEDLKHNVSETLTLLSDALGHERISNDLKPIINMLKSIAGGSHE